MIPAEFAGLANLARRTGHEPASVEVLPGDVGRRRYLRLTMPGGKTALGVVYPPEEADSRRRWLAARAALADRVRVPQVIADDLEGNQIVEDLGRRDLAALFLEDAGSRAPWLAKAADAAATIAGLPDPGINPPFDAAFFRRELELAREAVFDLHLQAPLSPSERRMHDAWADALCAEIAAHPRALCHRDFHGNNLFPVGGAVAAIDFQDMREGPDAYDLASLLWERLTLSWMTAGAAQGAKARFCLARGLETGAFDRRFDRVLLQRAWKVCGTFARAVAQGKGDVYRAYLPGEVALVWRLLGDEAPDRAFRPLFEKRVAAVLS
ncbi:MAG: phosphotransferase [Thermoanaerobaculia bacterium]